MASSVSSSEKESASALEAMIEEELFSTMSELEAISEKGGVSEGRWKTVARGIRGFSQGPQLRRAGP